MTIRHRNDKMKELVKAVRINLQHGKTFELGCTSADYYASVLAMNFPEAKIEKTEDGVRVS